MSIHYLVSITLSVYLLRAIHKQGIYGMFLFMNTDKNITAGKLVIDVAYFIFHVHSETHNFCDETPCPATGEFVLASKQTLPSFTPPGSYTLTMKLLGDSNEELTCISFGFSIGFVTPNAII
ncbi:hypothetical protein SETIT_9G062900v2 [Setaria italica]|uniref:MD-2-related lipid-recognition domain-containing protein n=1 Tax=Setaria italica TaxID=4555 RepID=K4AGQ0_SETIT|nr:hypothetical protein SETIT_9G062900v2 [Setaria italica]